MSRISSNKRALLIGVNKYPNLPDYSQLRGCVNDVEIMRQTLETAFQFRPENIRVLCDEQATRANIMTAMDQLVDECQQDDIVVFHYSGHGSQMVALGEKPTGYDESIMPYDSGRMNPAFPVQVPGCDIRDTEIREWLTRLTQTTANVTLIFDSCHSGSITRMQDSDDEGTRLRWIEADRVQTPAQTRAVPPELGTSGWLPMSEKYVLLAACAAEQGAYELDAPAEDDSRRHGAFTYFLTQELNRTVDNTYQDVWDMVALKVNSRFQKQTPQLEGARDRRIFDVSDFKPMRYLLVKERTDSQVVIAGGMVHGLSTGSLWAAYPPGTKELSNGNKQGEVEIRSATATEAIGHIISEISENAIVAGARAVEIVHIDPELALAVYVAKAPKNYEKYTSALRRELEESASITLTRSRLKAQVIISIESETWAAVDQSQAQLMTKCPVVDDNATQRVRENLETLWRFQKVLELQNENSSLQGKVDFSLLRKEVNGRWQPVGSDAMYEDGESIAFSITNRSGIPIHISVLDLGLSKRVSLLHPRGSASELTGSRSGGAEGDAEGCGTLTVGVNGHDEIELSFPENLTFLNGNGNGDLRGREIFKLCVTTTRHDLAFLNQSGLRMNLPATFQNNLEHLMLSAVTAGRTREATSKLHRSDDWLTIERPFTLKKTVN